MHAKVQMCMLSCVKPFWAMHASAKAHSPQALCYVKDWHPGKSTPCRPSGDFVLFICEPKCYSTDLHILVVRKDTRHSKKKKTNKNNKSGMPVEHC